MAAFLIYNTGKQKLETGKRGTGYLLLTNSDNAIGKICPYCTVAIQAGDSIVICSSCEMPHHKECWEENKGCTTFGCLGQNPKEAVLSKIKGTQHENTVNQSMCTKCGLILMDKYNFCPHCGIKISNEEGVTCSKCGYTLSFKNNYCPRCGTRRS